MQRTYITKTTITPENGKNKTDFQKDKEIKASKIVFLNKKTRMNNGISCC